MAGAPGLGRCGGLANAVLDEPVRRGLIDIDDAASALLDAGMGVELEKFDLRHALSFLSEVEGQRAIGDSVTGWQCGDIQVGVVLLPLGIGFLHSQCQPSEGDVGQQRGVCCLCRHRHKAHYADAKIMPTDVGNTSCVVGIVAMESA